MKITLFIYEVKKLKKLTNQLIYLDFKRKKKKIIKG